MTLLESSTEAEKRDVHVPISFNLADIDRYLGVWIAAKDSEALRDLVLIMGFLEKGLDVSFQDIEDAKLKKRLRHLFYALDLQKVGEINQRWRTKQSNKDFPLKEFIRQSIRKAENYEPRTPNGPGFMSSVAVTHRPEEVQADYAKFKAKIESQSTANLWGKSEREQEIEKQFKTEKAKHFDPVRDMQADPLSKANATNMINGLLKENPFGFGGTHV